MIILSKILQELPENSSVLDYGRLGWNLTEISVRNDITHHGCDLSKPHDTPKGVVFHQVDPIARKILIRSDYFDLVVASHVFEHVQDPLELFQELVRIFKPLLFCPDLNSAKLPLPSCSFEDSFNPASIFSPAELFN